MTSPSPRPTREQVARSIADQIDWTPTYLAEFGERAAIVEQVLRLAEHESASELRALRAELEPYLILAPQACTAGKHPEWLIDSEHTHACPWCEIARVRAELGTETGMRTAAVDELETLRRRLWPLLNADQLSDDDTVERLRAALAPEHPEPDLVEDGVEYWEIPGEWDVERDATSTLHGPTYRVGGREISAYAASELVKCLTAALTTEET